MLKSIRHHKCKCRFHWWRDQNLDIAEKTIRMHIAQDHLDRTVELLKKVSDFEQGLPTVSTSENVETSLVVTHDETG